jgi:meso-butanediol dehydrogenase / (S,S)-butanediol dehydrogenase / diacetyl reductase
MGTLNGRSALVTGAARGIGRAISEALLREGANVALCDIDPIVSDVAKTIGGKNDGQSGRAIGVTADASKRDDVRAAVKATVAAFGSLDIMFNNAGINKPLNFMDVTEENWDLIMRVNSLSVLIGTQEAARQMIAQGKGGKIINTASVASRQGYANMAPYCASKAAVLSLTQAAARGLASHKITVNGFAPGVVLTPLWEQLDKDLYAMGASKAPGEAMSSLASAILLGRVAAPTDVVGTVRFLASPASDYMTGQVLLIDGGMILQ